MGEDKLKALIQESLSVATKAGAMKPCDLSRVIVDTTVQSKNVMFTTDAKLINRARKKLVRLAKKCGTGLRQSYSRVGKFALIKHQRYAHAHQFKRANRSLKKLKTYLGRVIGDIARKISSNEAMKESRCLWRGASLRKTTSSTGQRFIPCTRLRSSASERARRIAPTNSQ
jgi:IS5 family transposase